jgi:anti-sigma factor RsiW
MELRSEAMTHDHAEMTCREMVEHLSAYLDGELDTALRAMIDAHEGECPPCRAFVRTLAATVAAVRALPREPLPPKMKANLAEALRRARRSGTP